MIDSRTNACTYIVFFQLGLSALNTYKLACMFLMMDTGQRYMIIYLAIECFGTSRGHECCHTSASVLILMSLKFEGGRYRAM